jgi:hypothetical protein
MGLPAVVHQKRLALPGHDLFAVSLWLWVTSVVPEHTEVMDLMTQSQASWEGWSGFHFYDPMVWPFVSVGVLWRHLVLGSWERGIWWFQSRLRLAALDGTLLSGQQMRSGPAQGTIGWALSSWVGDVGRGPCPRGEGNI